MICKNLSLKRFIEIIECEENWKNNKGLFWTLEGEIFVGMDNSTGEVWVEEFNTFKDCIDWLFGY